MKNLLVRYANTIPIAYALVLGYNMKTIGRLDYKDKFILMTKNLALSCIWPITAPSAIKYVLENSEFGPCFLNN